MIQTQKANSSSHEDASLQQHSNLDPNNYKQYYIDLLLKQNDIYEESQGLSDPVRDQLSSLRTSAMTDPKATDNLRQKWLAQCNQKV